MKDFGQNQRRACAAIGVLQRMKDLYAFLTRAQCGRQSSDVELELSERAKRRRGVVHVTQAAVLGQRSVEQRACGFEVEAVDGAVAGAGACQRRHQNATATIEVRSTFEKLMLRVSETAAHIVSQREVPRRKTNAPRIIDRAGQCR